AKDWRCACFRRRGSFGLARVLPRGSSGSSENWAPGSTGFEAAEVDAAPDPARRLGFRDASLTTRAGQVSLAFGHRRTVRMSDPRLRPFHLPPIDSLPPTGTSLQDMLRFVGAFEMPVIRLFQERWGQRYKQRVQACWSESIRRFKAGGA